MQLKIPYNSNNLKFRFDLKKIPTFVIIIRAYSYAYDKITALKIKGATLQELALWQSNVHVQIWPERGFDKWHWAEESIDKKPLRQRRRLNADFLYEEKFVLQDRLDNIDFLTYWKLISLNDSTNIFPDLDEDEAEDADFLNCWDPDIVDAYWTRFNEFTSFREFYIKYLREPIEDISYSLWYVDWIGDILDDYSYEMHEQHRVDYFKNKNSNYQDQTVFEKEVEKFLKKQAVQLAFLETYWTIIGKLPRPPLEHTLFIAEWTLKLESTNYWLPGLEIEDNKNQALQSIIEDEDLNCNFMCYFGVNAQELSAYDSDVFYYDMSRFKKRKKNKKHQTMNRNLLSKTSNEVCLYNKSPFLLNICCRKCL
jgi:hypothetical protein